MEEFGHLKIQLKDVMLATNTFAQRIGGGGFGSVYKGELSHPAEGPIMVACKRLDPKFGQGHVEFLKEIVTLSKYKHENVVSLLHFCIEGDERILVYEYASRGSLDCYLSDASLNWIQRLKICVGVAHALNYLHDPADTHQRILHRDIKSSNILLDEEWNAKVSDFGLSKFGPANQPQTYLVSNAVGTLGYCDPVYWETGILSKESDVYSFGVVLFEVMCGSLCYESRYGRLHGILVPIWKKSFEEKRLDDIIFHGLKEQIELGSLKTFSTVAYQCLEKTREERPTMAEIVQQLEMALEQQEVFEDLGKRMNFEGMRSIADLVASPLSCITQSQFLLLFKKGMLVDDGKTWLSVNNNGQHCEFISARKCISTSDDTLFIASNTFRDSRFQYLFKYDMRLIQDLRLKVKTQLLSPNVTYIINLVYTDTSKYRKRVAFKYKLEEMKEYSTSCVSHVGQDQWRRTELFQFTSTKNEHYFDIHFSSEMFTSRTHIDRNMSICIGRIEHYFGVHFSSEMITSGVHDRNMSICIEGVEFCPVDNSKKEENMVDLQPIPYSEISDYWKQKLPKHYMNILKLSKDIGESMSGKEVYFRLRKGIYIYINKSQQINQWFSISKNSKKRLMLPARAILPKEDRHSRWLWKSLPGSRFKEVAESCDNNHLDFSFQIDAQILTFNIEYACYLVFKLPENASVFEGIVITCFDFKYKMDAYYIPKENQIYLVAPPHTPVIQVSPGHEGPSRTRKIKGHPKLRKDGWMEIQVWDFYNNYSYPKNGYLESLNEWNFTGLLVQGIEFRPAKFSSR